MEQCTICGSSQLESLYQINAVPIYCNVLYDNSDSARNCCKGDIHLAYCTACEFIMNTAFDPGLIDYHQEYNNSLYCSAYFRKFVQQQITDLVDRYQLNNKKILEIGCGDGNYLTDLCLAGDNHGIGYDPSYLPQDKHQAHNQKIKFITDYYTADNSNPDADLICCRQTLEHIPNPLKFLKMLRNSLGEQSNTSLFFEVPNALFIPTEPVEAEIFAARPEGKDFVSNWKEFVGVCRDDIVKNIDEGKFNYSMIVIDTIDELYQFCTREVCKGLGIKDPSEKDFGVAYRLVTDKLLDSLKRLSAYRKLVLISHEKLDENFPKKGMSKLRPSVGSRETIKSLESWVTIVGRISNDTDNPESDKRKITFRGTDYIMAKDNSLYLDPVMPLDFEQISKKFNGGENGH